MALISEEIGIGEFQSASTFLRQMAVLLTQCIRDRDKKGFMDESMKGAKALLSHIKSGGKVSYQGVAVENAALFEKLLKHQGVAYTRITEADGKAYYITKDSDNKKVEHAFEMLSNELKIGFKEQNPLEFLSDNEGNEVGQAKGYSEAEIEVFRLEAAERGFSYAVINNEDDQNKFDILFEKRDEETVRKALKGMAYELSGEDGKSYLQEINKSLDLKKEVLAESKINPSRPIYLVNPENPMQFITIQDGILIKHSLSVEEKTDRKQNSKMVIQDKTRKIMPFGSRELLSAMKEIGSCAIVPAEEMDFIDGFDSARAVQIGNAKKAVTELKELQTRIKEKRYRVFESKIDRKNKSSFEKVQTLTDIDPETLLQISREMQKEGLSFTSVSGDFLYLDKDKEAVNKILNRTLFKDMTPLERFQERLIYEGRIPKEEAKGPRYIISAENPNFVICLDKTNFSVVKNGKEILKVDNSNPKYEQQLSDLLLNLKEVAVLTENEMKASPEKKIKTIEDRIGVKENQAYNQFHKSFEEKKNHFINSNLESASPEYQKIYKEINQHNVVSIYVNRDELSKTVDKEYESRERDKKLSIRSYTVQDR